MDEYVKCKINLEKRETNIFKNNRKYILTEPCMHRNEVPTQYFV